MRALARRGPMFIANRLGLQASTVGRVLRRHQMQVRGRRVGYDYVHAAIDDHFRLAYLEIHPDETGATCAGFLDRAIAFYARLDVRVEGVITDNALAYRKSTRVPHRAHRARHHTEIRCPQAARLRASSCVRD